jgi:hypothetical protein
VRTRTAAPWDRRRLTPHRRQDGKATTIARARILLTPRTSPRRPAYHHGAAATAGIATRRLRTGKSHPRLSANTAVIAAGGDVAQVLADAASRPPSNHRALSLWRARGWHARRSRRCSDGRARELDRAVGPLLLVTVAGVPLEDVALRRHRLREVCDSYMRVPSETTTSVASPTDDFHD